MTRLRRLKGYARHALGLGRAELRLVPLEMAPAEEPGHCAGRPVLYDDGACHYHPRGPLGLLERCDVPPDLR